MFFGIFSNITCLLTELELPVVVVNGQPVTEEDGLLLFVCPGRQAFHKDSF